MLVIGGRLNSEVESCESKTSGRSDSGVEVDAQRWMKENKED